MECSTAICQKFTVPAALTFLLGAAVHNRGAAQEHTPEQIIERAVAYHDPSGVWEKGRIQLNVHTVYSEDLATRVGSKEATLALTLSPGHEEFGYTKVVGGDKTEISVRRGQGIVVVNGSANVSDGDKERLRLREAVFYRDYCEYLYGMPMKLRDPGTILHPQASRVPFNDREVWQLKVTYDPKVGSDTWYFYFDRDTFALVGYKFYHDESKNDGEYITLEGEVIDQASRLRLPKVRAWYYNTNDGHLATDDIVSMSTSLAPRDSSTEGGSRNRTTGGPKQPW